MMENLADLGATKQLLFVSEQEVHERLTAGHPLAGEGVVEERLVEEGDTVAIAHQDPLGHQHVRVVDQVPIVQHLDRHGKHLPIAGRVRNSGQHLVEPNVSTSRSRGLTLAFPERLEQRPFGLEPQCIILARQRLEEHQVQWRLQNPQLLHGELIGIKTHPRNCRLHSLDRQLADFDPREDRPACKFTDSVIVLSVELAAGQDHPHARHRKSLGNQVSDHVEALRHAARRETHGVQLINY